jgi:WD40 repeat protein
MGIEDLEREDEAQDEAGLFADDAAAPEEISPAEKRRRAWRWRAILFASLAFLLIWGGRAWRAPAGATKRHVAAQSPWAERGEAGGRTSTVMALRALPQGGFVSVASDGRLALWGTTLSAPDFAADAGQSINSVAAGGGLLVVGASDGTVRALPTGGAAAGGDYGRFDDGPALSLDLSPDNRLLVGGGMDGNVFVWDATTRRQVASFAAGSAIKLARFVGAGEVLTVSYTGLVERWSASNGTALGPPTELPVGSVASADLSPDKQTLVVGTGAVGEAGGEVLLWDLAAARPLKTLADFQGEIGAVAFSADNRLVALCDDFRVGVFDRDAGAGRVARLGSDHRCSSLTFAADGHSVVVGQEDGQVYRYEP